MHIRPVATRLDSAHYRPAMQQPQRHRDTLAALNAMAFMVLALLLLIYAHGLHAV